MVMSGINIFLGYETSLFGFYIAAIVLATILLVINALHISLHIRNALHIQPKQAEKTQR